MTETDSKKMNFLLKLSIAVAIIILCSQIGKKMPSLAGLIATMPLTGVIVMVWLYHEKNGNHEVMVNYAKGAVLGIIPSIFFFFSAFLCFKHSFSLPAVLLTSFGIWLIGAFIHQWFLR